MAGVSEQLGVPIFLSILYCIFILQKLRKLPILIWMTDKNKMQILALNGKTPALALANLVYKKWVKDHNL